MLNLQRLLLVSSLAAFVCYLSLFDNTLVAQGQDQKQQDQTRQDQSKQDRTERRNKKRQMQKGGEGKGRAREDNAPKVGEEAPTFVLKSLDGKSETDLATFKDDKPVILLFGSYT